MRIFVTGADGFIGSHFLDHATAAGHETIGLSRRPRPGDARTHLLQGDICNPESFASALAGIDCVCHFAAAFREAGQPDAHFQRVNVDGTASLMAAAARSSVERR